MSASPRKIADRFVSSVWNEGEIERLDDLVAPDVESRLNSEVLQGRGALKDFVWQFHRAFPDLLVEVDSTVLDEAAIES
jgi:predicted SnoaL-like aldol condensation-catalyzing enzyme